MAVFALENNLLKQRYKEGGVIDDNYVHLFGDDRRMAEIFSANLEQEDEESKLIWCIVFLNKSVFCFKNCLNMYLPLIFSTAAGGTEVKRVGNDCKSVTPKQAAHKTPPWWNRQNS